MNKSLIFKFLVSIVLPVGVGAIGGLFTADAVPEWFNSLNKPWFSPPNWLFGPVWTTLYLLMGISLYIIWKQPRSKARNTALLVFILQLVLNFGWTFLFFYFQQIGSALVEIIVLWISILIMIVLFYRIKPLAAFINIPYLLWVSFATLLTAAYYSLN